MNSVCTVYNSDHTNDENGTRCWLVLCESYHMVSFELQNVQAELFTQTNASVAQGYNEM